MWLSGDSAHWWCVSRCGGKSGGMVAVAIDKLALPEQRREDPHLLGNAYKQACIMHVETLWGSLNVKCQPLRQARRSDPDKDACLRTHTAHGEVKVAASCAGHQWPLMTGWRCLHLNDRFCPLVSFQSLKEVSFRISGTLSPVRLWRRNRRCNY